MSTDIIKKAVGNYLKQIRMSKKITAKMVGNELGVSQSYISGVENAQKTLPKIKFIQDYLSLIAESSIEFNKYADDLFELSNGHIKIPKIENFNDHVQNNNVLTYLTDNGEKKNEFLNFPVNDLKYHLFDVYNTKYYGKAPLDMKERIFISKIIENCLENSFIDSMERQIKDFEFYSKMIDNKTSEEYQKQERLINDFKKILKNKSEKTINDFVDSYMQATKEE